MSASNACGFGLLAALPASVENVRLRETACLNRDIEVQLFSGREAALAWLKE